jgi:GMP synthase (glutamine-hydrolysing)
MNILVIDCGSSKVPNIVKMLEECGATVSVQILADKKKWSGDGVVISGAPILLTEKDNSEYLNLSYQIKTSKVPLLGICFGHQLIGLHYGAEIKKCNEDRDWQDVHFFRDTKLNLGFSEVMKFKEDHCECITLPEEFDLVASSKTCENEMMKHQTKNIFGVQFHPEVSDENGKIMLMQFVHLCKRK